MEEKIIFVCESCGNESAKWQGRCLVCGEWNSFREIKISPRVKSKEQRAKSEIKPERLKDIKIKKDQRISTKIGEFDRVLGGGIVPGSLILLGGEPGIGKSTLLFQVASLIAPRSSFVTLYVSGEESKEQLKMRAERLGIKEEGIYLLSETDIDAILNQIPNLPHPLLIIDSIQTMYDENFPSTPGSIVQVRECALKLQQYAKSSGNPIILVGHVTKEGAVAGPRTLEHLVDVVLYLEGERYHGNRILRAVKNRYGATDEIGVFQMTERGLVEIKNPSAQFLEERILCPGSVVTAIVEGTRPFLVEVQALTSQTSFGYPKRAATGYSLNRLLMLVAVLEQRAGINLSNKDIYVNVVGGLKITEPAGDLAVAVAIASAEKGKAVGKNLSLFGEVGLSGEVRSVLQKEKRKQEARRLGFSQILEAKTLSQAIKKSLDYE